MRSMNTLFAACTALVLCYSCMAATMAQAQSDEYLPPWQRAGGDTSHEPGVPEPITPPNKSGTYESPPRYDRVGQYEPYDAPAHRPDYNDEDSYTLDEIVDAGRGFFGGVSKSLAKVVEYAFKEQGRPNGYILGEEAGGAFVAGLRYGEGTLYTKNAGNHPVYWQGPSVGYDFGAEGSKTMVLVYNLTYVEQIYHRFAGIDGSAYLVGGVGITFQTYDNIVLAPIRAGVGLRLGANVGYLKYTRTRSWNPF